MNKSLHVMLVKEIHIHATRPIMHSHQKYKTAIIIRLPGKSKIELLCCTNINPYTYEDDDLVGPNNYPSRPISLEAGDGRYFATVHTG